jgi:choline monooxygenase
MTKTEFDWTLPSRDYRDPVLFERERREIFAGNWMLFSWSERMREPGDYVQTS